MVVAEGNYLDNNNVVISKNEEENNSASDTEILPAEQEDNNTFIWLNGLRNGLLLVFATISVYALILLIIFLIVKLLAKKPCPDVSENRDDLVLNPIESSESTNMIQH